MPEADNQDDIEAAAIAVFEDMTIPRRRVRPRVAEAFRRQGEDMLVETEGGGVQAWRVGEGPAVLLVHGWADDNSLWSPMINKCLEMGRPVVAFDLPAHGFSPAETVSVQAAGEAILRVAEAFGPIDCIMGHSFGCPSSMYAMANGLKVERAVLIASPLHRADSVSPDDDSETELDLDDARVRASRRSFEEASPAVQKRAMEIYAERMGGPRQGFDQLAAAPQMTAKALLVGSYDDRITPAANTQALHDAWPDSDIMMLAGPGHRVVAQHPDVVERAVYFVEGLID